MAYNHHAVQAKKQREEWEKHVEQQLRENFDVYSKDLQQTEEGLLADQRTDKSPNTTIEAQLEKARTGTAQAVTEKRLDTEKGLFTDHRHQVQAKAGQVPALEAKRLADKPVEDEKYEAANEN